jgi:hypothetical protein
MIFSFTFLSLQAFVLVWYACKFLIAFSLFGSNISFDSISVGLYMASDIVLTLLNLISFGVTASSPNSSLNGVKLVDLEMAVL